jgi:FtsP/CotA-like multicopper oxidase with cupredoxin domain
MGRAAIIVACVVLAVGGFFIARGSSDDGSSSSSDSADTTTTENGSPSTTSAVAKPSAPGVTRVALRAKGGQPVGGTKKISIKAGEPLKITVVSDTADEAHLHGYDVEKELQPNRPALFNLPKTNLQGVFELELHHSGAVLAKLEVNP